MKKEAKRIKAIAGQYSVNPSYSAERVESKEWKEKIKSIWEFTVRQESGTSGNVKMYLHFDVETQSFVFKESFIYSELHFSQVISSPLLLYRLICTFNAAPSVMDDPYKTTWDLNLVHKPSGKLLMFSEWKGSARFWLPDYTYKDLEETFKNDLLDLLNYLVSDQCTHPYDGVLAGSVA